MVVHVSSDPDRRSRYIFITPHGTPQTGPMILNSQGQLVWFHQVNGTASILESSNLEVQSYRGHPVLTWWQGYPDKGGPANGEDVIQHIKRVSTPGRRVYRKAKEMKPVLGGMGITIVSTSSGIYSDREARQKNIGGEVLCEIY